MLVEKMGHEAVELGHGEANITGLKGEHPDCQPLWPVGKDMEPWLASQAGNRFRRPCWQDQLSPVKKSNKKGKKPWKWKDKSLCPQDNEKYTTDILIPEKENTAHD